MWMILGLEARNFNQLYKDHIRLRTKIKQAIYLALFHVDFDPNYNQLVLFPYEEQCN